MNIHEYAAKVARDARVRAQRGPRGGQTRHAAARALLAARACQRCPIPDVYERDTLADRWSDVVQVWGEAGYSWHVAEVEMPGETGRLCGWRQKAENDTKRAQDTEAQVREMADLVAQGRRPEGMQEYLGL